MSTTITRTEVRIRYTTRLTAFGVLEVTRKVATTDWFGEGGCEVRHHKGTTTIGIIEDMPAQFHGAWCEEDCCTDEDVRESAVDYYNAMHETYLEEAVPMLAAAGYTHEADTVGEVYYLGDVVALEGDCTHATIPAAWEEAFHS